MDRETVMIISVAIMFLLNVWQYFSYKRDVKMHKISSGLKRLMDYAVVGFAASALKGAIENKIKNEELEEAHKTVKEHFDRMGEELKEDCDKI